MIGKIEYLRKSKIDKKAPSIKNEAFLPCQLWNGCQIPFTALAYFIDYQCYIPAAE